MGEFFRWCKGKIRTFKLKLKFERVAAKSRGEEGRAIKEARIKLKIYIAQWKIILKK